MARPAIVGLIFTGVIAVSTVLYTVFTIRLWRATKKAADAAKASADAAKNSADIATALHKPRIGILRFGLNNDRDSNPWVIGCVIKNFGTLPAERVYASIDVILHGESLQKTDKPSAVMFFPEQEETVLITVSMTNENRNAVFGGNALQARVKIGDTNPDGKWFQYLAQAYYDVEIGDFSVTESHVENFPA